MKTTTERIEEILESLKPDNFCEDIEILRLQLEVLVIQAQLEQLEKQ